MGANNIFKSLQPNFKATYSDSDEEKKKNRFKRTKTLLAPAGKATAELEASKNPQKFMKKMKNPSIKKLKGVAI